MAVPTLKQTGRESFSSTHMCVFHLHHISHTYVHTEDISHMHHTYTTCLIYMWTACLQTHYMLHCADTTCTLCKYTVCMPRTHHMYTVCTQPHSNKVGIMAQLPISCTCCTSRPFRRVPPCQLGQSPVHSAGKGRVMRIFFLLSQTLLFSLLVPALLTQVILALSLLLLSTLCVRRPESEAECHQSSYPWFFETASFTEPELTNSASVTV